MGEDVCPDEQEGACVGEWLPYELGAAGLIPTEGPGLPISETLDSPQILRTCRGKNWDGTEREIMQLSPCPCSSSNPPPNPPPLVNHQICNIKVSRRAVTNLECPGLHPDQLNQNSLGMGPRRTYFLIKSSGESSVSPRLKISDRLRRDTVLESQNCRIE